MADEITLSAIFKAAFGSSEILERITDLSVDMAGTIAIHNIQTVGTSEEALLLGDAGAGGWFFGINRDATNWVAIRSATGVTDLCKLLAGEFALFRLHGDASAPFVIADTSSCSLEYWLLKV